MFEPKKYIEENQNRFLDELFGLLRIPSISSQGEHREDMIHCANHWRELLLAAGADKCEVMPASGNPIVYGEKIIDPKAKTVLVYGHYDVMPVEPLNLWHTDPFEPVVKDGRIWGRGADDDKGQSFMHAKAFEYLLKSGNLHCNVKFMIEGEEEIGSTGLYSFCEEHREMLKSDIILVSDTGMIGTDTPSITVGLRGLCNMEVTVTGPDRDLHSGIFGGAVANPVNVLCDLISSLMNDKHEVTIPGFYDDVVRMTEEERALIAQTPFDLEKYKQSLGVPDVCGEDGYTTIERTGIRPNLGVCGIQGGYTGEGFKTILPSTAQARISMRLVANQDSRKIARLFEEHLKHIAPKYVKVEVKTDHGGEAYLAPMNMPAYKAAEQAFITTFGKRPIPYHSGGSIPIIAHFEKVLGVKSILAGFGLGEDNIHSPNENYKMEHFLKGIETICHFYRYYAEIS